MKRLGPKICFFAFLLFISISVFVSCGVGGMDNYNKGLGYQSRGEFDLAEQEYKIALQKNPNLAEAHGNIGLIYINKGWLDGAEVSTRMAIEILESTQKTLVKGSTYKDVLSVVYNNLGVIQIKRCANAETKSDKGKAIALWKEAISYFQKAIELDASNSNAQVNIDRFKNAYKE
jgi:tetratricopeptide (TPR) repeat protein